MTTDTLQKAREPWELRALLKELSEKAEQIHYLSSSHPQLASMATDEEKKEMRASFGDKCMQEIVKAHSMAFDMEQSIQALTAKNAELRQAISLCSGSCHSVLSSSPSL